MSTPLLSVCITVRDQPELLARCLVAAASIADETIVAVPPGSQDTANVATRLGARAVPASATRGEAIGAALDAARGRWSLIVHDDELLEPAPRRRLEETLDALVAPVATVELLAPGPCGDADRAHLPRLVRAGAARFRGSACVTLDAGDADRARAAGALPRSGLRLLGRGPRFAGHALPASRSAERRLVRDLVEAPDSPEVRLLLARSLVGCAGGDLLDVPGTRVALALLAPVVPRVLEDDRDPVAEPLVALALRLAHVTGDDLRTARWAARARAAFGRTARLTFAEAERAMWTAVQGSGSAARARRLFERVVTAPPGRGALPAPARLRGARSRVRAAACEALAGDHRALHTILAGATNGDRVEALIVRGWVAAKSDRSDRARSAIEEAVRRDRRDPRAHYARAALEFRAGRVVAARGAASQARALAPGWCALAPRGGSGPDAVRVCGLVAPWTRLVTAAPS